MFHEAPYVPGHVSDTVPLVVVNDWPAPTLNLLVRIVLANVSYCVIGCCVVVFSAVKLLDDSVCDVFRVQIFLPHGFEVGLDANVVVPDPYGALNVIVPLGVVPGTALKIITVEFTMLLTV